MAQRFEYTYLAKMMLAIAQAKRKLVLLSYAGVLSQKFACFQRAIQVLWRGVPHRQWWFHWQEAERSQRA
ncbi:hypothetical protein GCM10011297_30830 [Bacterioplanes sanyensis]|nr:hypothetical protein GCM10011297_30830 [Bacterioplanes sanyensis]